MNKEKGIFKLIRSAYYGIKTAPYRTKKAIDTRSLKRFRDKHKGESCFVIGNGPSMTFADLDRIHELKVPSFACNKIFLGFKNTDWRPDYFFVSDTKIIKDIDVESIGLSYDTMFFPRMFKKEIKRGNYYEKLEHDWLNSDKFSTDAYEGVYGRETIIVEMLQLAYYMGFSTVYIIGVDFSYNMKNVDTKNLTFENVEGNYFIKDYAKPGEVLNLGNQHSNLLGFQAARKAFEENGREIYNSTRGGKLEVFIRKDLDKVFEELAR